MNSTNREYFDLQVEWVLSRLPKSILHTLREVPLHVVDQPAKKLLIELKIGDPEDLCGYFCGTPLTECRTRCSVPTSVTLFRRGIIAASRNEHGTILRSTLREQIRITLLHELAHLHGMEEDEIERIGYG